VSTETVTDQANGQTIDLQQGQVLQVVLSSTYWMIHGSSDSAVLSQLSGPNPQPQRSGCVPGQGCGIVTAAYRAVAAGQAQVSASRGVCGEALGCTAANSQFVVYVIVK
jgi:predicted secreted protein